jgi:hypothetical protein
MRPTKLDEYAPFLSALAILAAVALAFAYFLTEDLSGVWNF